MPINKNRTPDMDCMLCKTNKATKKKSHIISDFLGKSMLGEQNQKKAFFFDPSKLFAQHKPLQDTPKQNFILCPSCERYFGILETYISKNVYNRLWDERFKDDFTVREEGIIKWRIYTKVDPLIFYLFIYSIVWRCSISSEENFDSFKIDAKVEEQLREIILKYKNERETDLISFIIINSSNFPFYEYKLITAESFVNKMENFYFHTLPDESINQCALIFNEFSLQFSFFEKPEKTSKIGFVTSEDWDKYVKFPIMRLDISNAIWAATNIGDIKGER